MDAQHTALQRVFPDLKWTRRGNEGENRFWNGTMLNKSETDMEINIWMMPGITWEIIEWANGGHVGSYDNLLAKGRVAGDESDFEAALEVIKVFWKKLTSGGSQ